MKQLYFMRHGLSDMNKLGLFSGRTNTGLAPEGVEQCRNAAKTLKNIKIDVIVSSPMKRALDSARLIADEIGYSKDKIIVDNLFMERRLGSLEGKKYIQGLDINKYDDAEHSQILIQRAKKGLKFLNMLNGDNILLVSHSAFGRALQYTIDSNNKFHEIKGYQNAEIVRLI